MRWKVISKWWREVVQLTLGERLEASALLQNEMTLNSLLECFPKHSNPHTLARGNHTIIFSFSLGTDYSILNFCPEEPCWVTGHYSETRYIPSHPLQSPPGIINLQICRSLGEAPNWIFNVSDEYRSRWRDPFKSSIPKRCENPKEAVTRFFSHCPC